MRITIRRATVNDAESLAAVSRQTFYDTFTGTCTEEDMQSFLDTYFNVDQVRSELSNENDFYFLAEDGGAIAGYLRFMEGHEDFPEVQQWRALELKRIYLTREYQGKGVAQLLMDQILQFAKQNSYEVVFLGVWEHNLRAQKFYSKYGFENSGHTHDFPIGSTPQMDNWFWKFL